MGTGTEKQEKKMLGLIWKLGRYTLGPRHFGVNDRRLIKEPVFRLHLEVETIFISVLPIGHSRLEKLIDCRSVIR